MTKIFTAIPRYFLYTLTLYLLLPGSPLLGQTQKISFKQVNNRKGTALGKVNAMVQDKQGFMWFSDQSNAAIVRYDGSNMEFFSYDPDDPNSLGGAYPETLFASDDGTIWIGFFGQGLDRFDPATKTFTHFRHDDEDPKSLVSDYVSAIQEDHLGNIWVGTTDGLDLLDPEQGTFRHFRHDGEDPGSLSHNVVRSLYEDRSGTLWVGTGWEFYYLEDQSAGGLNRFDRASETFAKYFHDPQNPNSLLGNKVRAILEDSHGNFWVGTDRNGLHTMDRETGEFTRYTPGTKPLGKPDIPLEPLPKNSNITFLTEDSTGHIWIGTLSTGLVRYDPEAGTSTHLGNRDPNPTAVLQNEGWNTYLQSNSGWCGLASKEGLFWLGTQANSRVFRVDLFSNSIPFKEALLTSSGWTMPSFYEDASGGVWIGNGDGLVFQNSSGTTKKIYRHDPKDPQTLSNTSVRAITGDYWGKIWVGTNNGLNELDPVSGQSIRYLPDAKNPYSLGGSEVTTIFEDNSQRIWAGTLGGGLTLLDRDRKIVGVYQQDPDNPLGISGNNITDIDQDNKGYLWISIIGNGNGVNRIDSENQTIKHYLRGLDVMSLLVDAQDQVWAGTHVGLYRYNAEQDLFRHTGISSNLTTVIDDAENNLWLYTTDGLIKYDPVKGIKLLYGEKSGVVGFLEPQAFKSPYRKRDGSILISQMGYYYAFHPDSLWASRDTTRLFITDFKVNTGKGLSAQQAALVKSQSPDTLYLNYEQRDFSLGFTTIDFRNTEGGQISYMLENYDPDWLTGYAELPANYFRVPPGEYTFKLKATNSSSGIQSEKNLHIVVLPPWWQTWWAYSLYAFMLVLGVWSVHRYQKAKVIRAERARIQERELEQAKEIEKAYSELKATQQQLIHSEKMASLGELTAGIAHEIKNPLNFVNNFSEVSRELLEEMKEELKKGDTKEAEGIASDVIQNLEKIVHHGQRADSIVRGMLQHSRSGDGKKEATDLNALADEYLRLAYHGLRARDKSFNATMETDFDPAVGEVDLVPQDMGRVLLNLLTNAFHAVSERNGSAPDGYEPTVRIRTRKTDKGVEISVRDNGGGIPDEIKDKIFQPFFTTKPTGEGTGLGLSMAYDIVTKGHGGALTFTGTGPEGTEFRIFIPVNGTQS